MGAGRLGAKDMHTSQPGRALHFCMYTRLLPSIQRTGSLRSSFALFSSVAVSGTPQTSMAMPVGRMSWVDRAAGLNRCIQPLHHRRLHVCAPTKQLHALDKAWRQPRLSKSRGLSAATAAASVSACASLPTHFSQLFLKDFALVQEQTVKLLPGFTVITGWFTTFICSSDTDFP